jgi:hypothetical protein
MIKTSEGYFEVLVRRIDSTIDKRKNKADDAMSRLHERHG